MFEISFSKNYSSFKNGPYNIFYYLGMYQVSIQILGKVYLSSILQEVCKNIWPLQIQRRLKGSIINVHMEEDRRRDWRVRRLLGRLPALLTPPLLDLVFLAEICYLVMGEEAPLLQISFSLHIWPNKGQQQPWKCLSPL